MNFTTNTLLNSTASSQCVLGVSSRSTKTGLTCAYLFIFIVAVIGNTVVIYIVRNEKRLRISFNYFILSMATADLLHAVFAIPANIAYLYVQTGWFSGSFGTFLCKFVHYGTTVSIVASITTLSVTTIERYLAARLVLKRPMTERFAKRAIALIWLISGLLSINELVKYTVIPHRNSTFHCMPALVPDRKHRYAIEMTVKFIITYAFPLITMATLYTIIIWYLWQHNVKGVLNSDSYRRIQKRKRNLIKRLITITCLFALCWLPVHVNHFMATFHYQTYKCMPHYWPLLFFWLAHANSALNPILYLLLTKNARSLFRSSVHAARGDGNDTGSRRTTSRRKRMLQRLQSESRIFNACFTADTPLDVADDVKANDGAFRGVRAGPRF